MHGNETTYLCWHLYDENGSADPVRNLHAYVMQPGKAFRKEKTHKNLSRTSYFNNNALSAAKIPSQYENFILINDNRLQ
jgi:hypothetical protein